MWDAVVVEATATTGTIPAQAIAFDVAHVNFDTAYAELYALIITSYGTFTSMTATTDIVRATWDAKWENYYDERTQLLNAISTKVKNISR